MSADYVGTLLRIANRLETLDENGWVESAALREAAEHFKQLEQALPAYERIRNAIRHANPERTGAYFICGGSSVDDELGVPERVEICPAFGSDVVYTYKRTERIRVPQW
jgi:hypothetical protein